MSKINKEQKESMVIAATEASTFINEFEANYVAKHMSLIHKIYFSVEQKISGIFTLTAKYN